ncbi:conserved hypothetical protein [Pseudomonas sp. 8Z]|uniref:PA4575 family protein n=1 Tax=Pseudomonas sp. 8Z TaxID=2653166 RepID=UPI0012F1B9E5|nr:hypothetical protein [Pseudomonas sp. 8Z]VXD04979.1 conserved hypothetical protein [Pseudomonas sp. 8Z]
MPRSLCLTRDCLGLVTRIECVIKPLAGDRGLWTLICAAGMAGSQPTAIKAQGPFFGPHAAEEVLAAIVQSLAQQGYGECSEPPIWSLHQQAELRRLNDSQRRHPGTYRLRPDTDGQS